MRDRLIRRASAAGALAGLAAGAAWFVWSRPAPLLELLEALGVLDPYRSEATPEGALAARVAAVEQRWVEFDRNWPEPYRHAVATATFNRMGDRS